MTFFKKADDEFLNLKHFSLKKLSSSRFYSGKSVGSLDDANAALFGYARGPGIEPVIRFVFAHVG